LVISNSITLFFDDGTLMLDSASQFCSLASSHAFVAPRVAKMLEPTLALLHLPLWRFS
jgi:hypothetical protein